MHIFITRWCGYRNAVASILDELDLEMRLPAASLPNITKYEVSSSDTLTHIALQYNTTPTELSRLNHLSSSLLYPGQTLLVPYKTAENVCESAECTKTEKDTQLSEISENDASQTDREKLMFSPDRSLERLLNNEGLHTSDDEISRKYLKVKSKYVTDGHGVVAGVLLITPQTVMFNPCVSDHLVVERGREMYVVRLPLRAISKMVLFEDIAAMVVGDMTKQYVPKVNFMDYTSQNNVSPKPGMIVCQETGEKYALHENINTTKEKGEQTQQNIEQAMQDAVVDRIQENQIFPNVVNDESATDQGIGSSSAENFSSDSTINDITMTSQTSEPPVLNDKECTNCQNFADFMEDSQLSSTPKHGKFIDGEDSLSNVDGVRNTDTVLDMYIDANNLDANLTTSNPGMLIYPGTGDEDDKVGNVSQVMNSETETDEIKTDNSSIKTHPTCTAQKLNESNDHVDPANVRAEDLDIIAETMVENHFNVTPEMGKRNIAPELGEDITTTNTTTITGTNDNINTTDTNLSYYRYKGSKSEISKDSGTEVSSVINIILQDDNESKITRRSNFARGSSLSDEARQWLGKRGVKLSVDTSGAAHYTPESSECDLDSQKLTTPRPASKVDDPLMYVAIKVHKTYWCPIRAKQNQIMGIPPNRDQKRREHWFAIPRDKVDQFYNFLLYWAPDVYGEDSSGFSTPCSSECENVDEKMNRVDPGDNMEISRSLSLSSVLSKSSTRSLWDDEIPDLQAESQILTRKQVHLLTRKLPSRTVGHSWDLIYSTTIHGISLSTLYRNFQGNDTPVLIAVKDENDKVFGAFMSEPPKVSDGFYGTGESMLYTFSTDVTLKSYNWTGDNNFFIKGSKSSLVIGGGEGVFGLWLDEDLYHGRSHSCKTFGNDTLSSCEDFICCGLEAWGFV